MTTELLDPIHPGEILSEELMRPLRLSNNALALALRVPATRIGEIGATVEREVEPRAAGAPLKPAAAPPTYS